MFKRFLSFIFIFNLISNLTIGQVSFKINGQINNSIDSNIGIKNGDTIALRFSRLGFIKKTTIKNGKFEYQDTIKEPSVGLLTVRGSGFKLLVDTSEYRININQIEFIENEKKYIAYKSNIKTSSKFHTLWENFNKEIDVINNKIYILKDSVKNHNEYVDSVRIEKSIIKLRDTLIIKYNLLASKNLKNFATPYILMDAPEFSYNRYYVYYKSLTNEVKYSKLGIQFNEKLQFYKKKNNDSVDNIDNSGAKLIGTKIPNFSLLDDFGKNLKLHQIASKSKYLLVDFWASWCAPCRLTNLDLIKSKKTLNNIGVEIIGFSLDTDLSLWKKAIKNDRLSWNQFTDLNAVYSNFVRYLDISELPSNLLLSSTGIIIAKNSTIFEIINTVNHLEKSK